ncbi:MAG TPA: hypothetical protein PKV67_16410 [Hyphomonas sp.]|nr:hypothetical protein [Hyphomonas sp.]HRK68687.1 hypothetical protein [Hyphomonas sp.]
MTQGPEPAETLPTYATSPRPRRVKRVWLATFVASMAACLSVTLIGFILMGVTEALFFSAFGSGLPLAKAGFGEGVQLAVALASYNFFLFFVTVPAAALVLGLSVGRMPHRGITAMRPYLRWGAIWGAILVGGVTALFGSFGGASSAFGALVTGGAIGAIAGTFCGFLMHKIIDPVRQLTDVDVGVF